MEVTLLLQSKFTAAPVLATGSVVTSHQRRNSRVFSVLTSRPPATENARRVAQERILIADPAGHVSSSSTVAVDDNTGRRTAYQDSWFDLLAANHLSQSVQAAVGS